MTTTQNPFFIELSSLGERYQIATVCRKVKKGLSAFARVHILTSHFVSCFLLAMTLFSLISALQNTKPNDKVRWTTTYVGRWTKTTKPIPQRKTHCAPELELTLFATD